MCFLSLFPGKPIFSVDIHPDGTKFATGGQGMFIGYQKKCSQPCHLVVIRPIFLGSKEFTWVRGQVQICAPVENTVRGIISVLPPVSAAIL